MEHMTTFQIVCWSIIATLLLAQIAFAVWMVKDQREIDKMNDEI